MNTPRPETVHHPRAVERLVAGQPVMEGAGVKISRVLTQTWQRRLDPFLMLDIFHSEDPNDYLAGFPDHPHRGFETVTYMIAGSMRHRDSAGHEGLLQSGGAQWMVAGNGVVHSEMPEQEDGVMEGFQLWLNLPARDKMAAPWYRDIPSGEIPEFVTAEGVTVRVIAGESHGVAGAISRPVTEPFYLVGNRNHWAPGEVVTSARRRGRCVRGGACRRCPADIAARSPNVTAMTTARARSASCPR